MATGRRRLLMTAVITKADDKDGDTKTTAITEADGVDNGKAR